MMEEKKFSPMPENPLRSLENVLGLKILKSPFIKAIIIFSITLIELVNVTGLYLSIQKDQFQNYITYILISQPAVGGLMATIFMLNAFERFKSNIDISDTDDLVKKKIIQQCKTTSRADIFLTIAVMLAHIVAIVPFYGDEENFIPYLMALRHSFSFLWDPVQQVLVIICALISGMATVYPLIFGSYLVALGKIHLNLAAEKLLVNTEGFDGLKEESLFYNEKYQEAVHARLRGCVRKHLDFKSHIRKSMQLTRPLIIFVPFGTLVPVGVGYFIYNNVSPKNNIRMAFLLAGFVAAIASLCTTGQAAEDESDELFRVACDTNWTSWDQKNKKILLIFLLNLIPVKLKGYGAVGLNFRLLLKFYKWIHTAVSILY